MALTLTSQNTVAWHNRNTAEHDSLLNKWGDKKFRTLSLSIYGEPQDPLYAAVMVKRPVVVAGKQVGPLNQVDMKKTLNDMEKKKWGPYIMTATGPPDSAVFLGAFRPMNKIPMTRLNLTPQQFKRENKRRQWYGMILIWADAFGTEADTRYTGIWGPNISGEAWNCEAIDEGGVALKERFLALTDTWCRPSHIAVTPAGRNLELFVDSTIGPWSSRYWMTSDEYQEEFTKAKKNNLQPIRVSASGSGANARYAAIFASREEMDSRVFHAEGPVTVASIDSVMENVMEDKKIRGAALAIVRGTQLVYVKGYKYAEPEPIYPVVWPTTLFRLGSVSKIFAAVAMYRLLQQNPRDITLNKHMQSVLNLTQPDGSQPKDSRFNDIRIKHLLESNSGIQSDLHRKSKQAVDAAVPKKSLPATHEQIMRYIASFWLTDNPGAKDNVVYGSVGYFMLSQMIAKLAGASSFEEALNTLVLAPLKMTRTRGARTLVGSQAADEARYHDHRYYQEAVSTAKVVHELRITDSLKTADQPKVARQYNEFDLELMDGTGGLSSSVVDVARLAAMFSDRDNNPVLSNRWLDSLFTNAAKATSELTGPDSHGYHGFDGAQIKDEANHVYYGWKGGSLTGVGISLYVTTGGYSFVFAKNCNIGTGPAFNEIMNIAQAIKWDDKDLFVGFGMPSLTPIKEPVPTIPGLVLQELETHEELSLERGP